MSHFPISGTFPAQFETLRPVIAANRKDHEELGFQFCVMQNGETLIDICGGFTDRTQKTLISADTLFPIYSSGKVMAALVIAWLAEEDRLGYNQIIQTIWPEYGAKDETGQTDNSGKNTLTIAQILSHQSGLCGVTNPDWTQKDWLDWDKTIHQLETQAPIFTPGAACGYHPITYGFLLGEIARRTDAHNRTLGTIFREELAEPFGADVWLGLPPSEHERVAEKQKPRIIPDFGEINPATKTAFFEKWSSAINVDLSKWRQAELAASNVHATAKGLATLMQIGVDGRVGQSPVLSEDMQTEFSKSRISEPNLVLPFHLDFAAGPMRNAPNFFFGPNAETLGHSGWGGSCVWADPLTGLHGAYVMNRQHNSVLGDIRATTLIDAVYNAL